MATPLRPTSTKTFGRTNWFLVPAFANPDAPKVTEMNAAGALDVTDILFRDGTGKPVQETNLITQPERVGDTVTYQRVGMTTVQGGDLTYALNPQAASGSDGKKLYELIPEGTQMRLVKRQGVPKATDVAIGQFITSFPVEFGPSEDDEVGEGENGEAAARCKFAVTGPPSRLKALVA